MNYNNNKTKLEMDDMNIKSHLNTSLDLSGISVSEDLINRTLSAIKKSEQDMEYVSPIAAEKDTISKKVVPLSKYIRTIGGVVAAIFVVIVGYSAMKQNNMKFDSSKSAAPEQTYDMAAKDAATEENSTMSMAESTNAAPAEEEITDSSTDNDQMLQEKSDELAGITAIEPKQAEIQYTIVADTATGDVKVGSSAGGGMEGSVGEASPSGEGEMLFGIASTSEADANTTLRSTETVTIHFRDIFLSDAALAASITIENKMDGTSIALTNQGQITEFYAVMDEHQFTYASDVNAEQNYSVEVKDQTAGVYTMIIGTYIEVTQSQGETVSHSVYQAVDPDLLKQKLDEFYQSYKK